MTEQPQFEKIDAGDGTSVPDTYRLQVPGGWIYYLHPRPGPSCAVFVPDPTGLALELWPDTEETVIASQTRFEQIAAAFQLHHHRIVEEAHRQQMIHAFDAEPTETAGRTLAQSFCFESSVEGHEYWSALARGAGWEAV